jgi:D-alanyl-D-alanine dipeptidase
MRVLAISIAFVTACSASSSSSPPSAPPEDSPDASSTPAPPPFVSPIDPASTQLVTVVSADWSAVPATLTRYEPKDGAWSTVGEPVPVVLGKSGLGWGIGMKPAPSSDGPTKKEGDGRSPAGVFSLGSAFGYAAPADASFLKLPYLQATTDLECVDDPASSHYNTLVYRSQITTPDWNSSEIMKRPDALYRWGIFVNHNATARTPGGGSCIFLHLWSGPDSATVGCTAGDEARMKEVFAWLDPAKHPLIVQLPKTAYASLHDAWALP